MHFITWSSHPEHVKLEHTWSATRLLSSHAHQSKSDSAAKLHRRAFLVAVRSDAHVLDGPEHLAPVKMLGTRRKEHKLRRLMWHTGKGVPLAQFEAMYRCAYLTAMALRVIVHPRGPRGSSQRRRYAPKTHLLHFTHPRPLDRISYRPSASSFRCLLNLSAFAFSSFTESKNSSSLLNCPVLSTEKMK